MPIQEIVPTKKTSNKIKGHPFVPPSGDLLTDLILMVFKANAELVNAGPLIARDPALIAMRWQMLNSLRSEDRTASQLGREVGITRQGALQHVQYLEEIGYVTLKENAEDQRAKKVSLTPTGKAKLTKINRHSTRWLSELAVNFEKHQIDDAIEVLGKLRSLVLASVTALVDRNGT